MLRQRFPDLQVEGGNYPPSDVRAMLANVLSTTKLLAIAALLIADANMPEGGPEWFVWMRNNKVG